MKKEEWKNIDGFDGYQVSNTGKVRSLDRVVRYKDGREVLHRGIILKMQIRGDGYFFVSLRMGKKTYHPVVHRIVLGVFSPSDNMENLDVNHINGIKTDNSISNLEWATRAENIRHAFNIGLNKNYGECHYMAKLTWGNVDSMRKLYKTKNYSYSFLSKMFGVHVQTVASIIRREKWIRK